MRKEDLFNAISDINPEYIEGIKFNNKKSKVHISPALIAAAIALFIATPFVVNAATNGEFFERVWGTLGRENIPYREEEYYEAEKDTTYTIAYPQQEFVPLDPEVAEALIGDCVSYLDIVQEVNGTTISVLTAVRDSRAAIIEFTIEKEGGVDCLLYGQDYNESKGAYFADESTFYFAVGNYGSKIYVDLDRSTEDKLYCYSYTPLDSGLWLETNELPCTFGERIYYTTTENHDELTRIENETQTSRTTISCSSPVESIEFSNSDGGYISISPLSMSINALNGIGSTIEGLEPTENIYSVVIVYSDGSTYLVDEHINPIHTCEVSYANFSYAWGDSSYNLNYIFNRLVDTSDIAAIYVNNIEYIRAN